MVSSNRSPFILVTIGNIPKQALLQDLEFFYFALFNSTKALEVSFQRQGSKCSLACSGVAERCGTARASISPILWSHGPSVELL